MELLRSISAAATLLAYLLIAAKLLQLLCQGRVVATLSPLLNACRHWWWDDHAEEHGWDSEMQRKTQALLDERRVRIARHVAWVYLLGGVTSSLEPILDISGSFKDAAGPADPIRLPVALSLLLAASSVAFSDCMLKRRALPALYWTSMFLLCWAAVLMGRLNDESFMLSISFLMFRSTILGGLFLNIWIFSIANVLLATCAAAGYLTAPALGGLSSSAVIWMQALMFAVKFAILSAACWALKWSANREVEAQLGKCHTSAVMKLLDTMCDAVVDLDSQLKLKFHSLKLAGALMHSSGRSLTGVHITDFVAGGEERTHFCTSMLAGTATSDDGGPTPGLFTARFRDSLNNHVKFAVFHVPYRSVSGDWNHLVGLREDLGAEPSCAQQQTRIDANLGPILGGGSRREDNLLPQAHLRQDFATMLYSSSGLDSSVRESVPPQPSESLTPSNLSDSGSLSKESSHTTHGRLVLEVSLEEGLPIKLFTPSFRDTFGMYGTSPCLSDVLVGQKGTEFPAWLTHNSKLVLAGRSPGGVLSYNRLPLAASVADGQQGSTEIREYNAKVSFPKPPKNTQNQDYRVGIKLHSCLRRGRSAATRTDTFSRSEVEFPQHIARL